MLTQHFQRVLQLLETHWNISPASPDLVRLMRVALLPGFEEKAGAGYLRLMELPALCCQAAGGGPEWADAVTAAWLCFYQAAHLMDSLQDQDKPEPWWAELGAGAALNVASGLYFSASSILEGLHNTNYKEAIVEIVPEFYRTFLVMCNGQQRELTCHEPNLEQYWQSAADKSGVFFALACWAGARLATDEAETLEIMRKFGNLVGLLIQVRDDLEEFKPENNLGQIRETHRWMGALPVVYAREVLPENERSQLNNALALMAADPQASMEALHLIDQAGASLYILTEIERHQQLALEALQALALEAEAVTRLSHLVVSN